MCDADVRLTGHLICTTLAEAETLRAHLPQHVRLTRAEPGCLFFTVEATSDPLIWHVAERFRDRAAFAQHQSRTQGSIWAAATKGIKRDYRITGLD